MKKGLPACWKMRGERREKDGESKSMTNPTGTEAKPIWMMAPPTSQLNGRFNTEICIHVHETDICIAYANK